MLPVADVLADIVELGDSDWLAVAVRLAELVTLGVLLVLDVGDWLGVAVTLPVLDTLGDSVALGVLDWLLVLVTLPEPDALGDIDRLAETLCEGVPEAT